MVRASWTLFSEAMNFSAALRTGSVETPVGAISKIPERSSPLVVIPLKGIGEAFAFEVFGHLAKTLRGVGGGLFLLESPGAEKGGGAQGGKEIASSGMMGVRVGMRMRVRVSMS
jgi:hypothetical protein